MSRDDVAPRVGTVGFSAGDTISWVVVLVGCEVGSGGACSLAEHACAESNPRRLRSMEDVQEGKDYHFPKEEEVLLEHWAATDSFKEQLRRSEDKPEFIFYDGPPFATGLPHYGHLLAGSLKVRRTRHFRLPRTLRDLDLIYVCYGRTSSPGMRARRDTMSSGALAGTATDCRSSMRSTRSSVRADHCTAC